mgnify:CR=1 FL=1
MQNGFINQIGFVVTDVKKGYAKGEIALTECMEIQSAPSMGACCFPGGFSGRRCGHNGRILLYNSKWYD